VARTPEGGESTHRSSRDGLGCAGRRRPDAKRLLVHHSLGSPCSRLVTARRSAAVAHPARNMSERDDAMRRGTERIWFPPKRHRRDRQAGASRPRRYCRTDYCLFLWRRHPGNPSVLPLLAQNPCQRAEFKIGSADATACRCPPVAQLQRYQKRTEQERTKHAVCGELRSAGACGVNAQAIAHANAWAAKSQYRTTGLRARSGARAGR